MREKLNKVLILIFKFTPCHILHSDKASLKPIYFLEPTVLSIDKEICLEILEGYIIRTLALRILWWYWYCVVIVEQASGYYGTPFKGYRGVNEGYPIFTKMFNLVVNAIFRKWLMILEDMDEGLEVFDRML